MLRGVYLLVLYLKNRVRIRIRGNDIALEKGFYIYVGSAQRNLEKRVERHFKKRKKVFWHIDKLTSLEDAEIVFLHIFLGYRKRWECVIAGRLEKVYKPIYGFGCSDCKCRAHLFYVGP
jgi:Uri superfamily endonuclease